MTRDRWPFCDEWHQLELHPATCPLFVSKQPTSQKAERRILDRLLGVRGGRFFGIPMSLDGRFYAYDRCRVFSGRNAATSL